ncbi:MAG: ATP-binding protein [Methanobrevibacter sp.]|nr:ATP-binding protein [Methanobrevibacter sp.]
MEIPWGTDGDLDETQFYNRIEDIEFVSNWLNSTQNGSSPTILLTGVRGVGKTALIKKLKDSFKNEYLVISLDLSATDSYQYGKLSREGFMKKLYDETIKSCNDLGIKINLKKIEKEFKTHDIKLIKRFVDYEGLPIPISGFEDNYKKLSEFVMDLPQIIYEDNSENIKGVFIFIDEFQNIKDLEDMDSFLWYLRSKVQSQKNVAYLFSGSMSIKDSLIEEIAGRKGVFGGRMLEVHIEPFSYETTKQYLNDKAEYLKFTEDGLERFYKCTMGIPSYINTFAKLLSQNTLLDKQEVINQFEKSLRFLATHLITQWQRLTLQEQKIVVQLINKPLKRIEIADNLGVTTGSLSNPLNKLINEVLIELNDEKKYQISDPILSSWLKSEYNKKGVYPYRSF